MSERDLAIVLSGGGMNGLLLELGFLGRLREDPLWERVGWVYGTSAGALTGVMAAIDRLDALERFALALSPDETFRPNRLWQLPLTGLHDYALPETISARLAPIDELAREVVAAPIELLVCVTDVSDGEPDERDAYERVYSSRTTGAEELARAILASAAISALVLPLRVGDVIGTDGGWVRNFPLGHAYDNPAVAEIVGFRYVPRNPRTSSENLVRLRRRLEQFRAVPPVRALLGEVRAAEERQARGEPELRGEVPDARGAAGQCGLREPRGLAAAVLRVVAPDPLQVREDRVVDRALLQAHLRDAAEEEHGVGAAAIPQIRVHHPEQLARARIPAEAEVPGKLPEVLQGRRQLRDDGEGLMWTHGSPSGWSPGPPGDLKIGEASIPPERNRPKSRDRAAWRTSAMVRRTRCPSAAP